MKLSILLLTSTLLLLVTTARACDLCAVYQLNEAHGNRPGWSVGIAEQFTRFGTLQQDSREIGNDADQYLNSSVTQVLLGYNFNGRFALQVAAPFIYREFRRTEHDVIREDTASGLGDVSLLASYLLVHRSNEKFTFSWKASAGVKAPTGSTRRLKEETEEGHDHGAEGAEVEEGAHADQDHEHAEHEHAELPESGIHGHDLTLGSGSWDGVFSTSIFTRYERLFFAGTLQYSLRSKGDYDYRFANDLTWGGGPGVYLVLNEEWSVALQANCSGEHKRKDRFRGTNADDTGITAVYLGPEVSATWKSRLSAEFGVDLPVSIDNTALQIVPNYRLRAAITWRF